MLCIIGLDSVGHRLIKSTELNTVDERSNINLSGRKLIMISNQYIWTIINKMSNRNFFLVYQRGKRINKVKRSSWEEKVFQSGAIGLWRAAFENGVPLPPNTTFEKRKKKLREKKKIKEERKRYIYKEKIDSLGLFQVIGCMRDSGYWSVGRRRGIGRGRRRKRRRRKRRRRRRRRRKRQGPS